MNVDGRSTSEQLFIPNLLVVGASERLYAQCRIAANTYGLAIRICSLRDAAETFVRRRPLAIVVPDDLLDETMARELEAFARDVRAVLLRVDADISVREIEAMLGGAVGGVYDTRDRRGGATGRYSVVDVEVIEEEEPFPRRTPPPPSAHASAPPPARTSTPPAPASARIPSAPAPASASARVSAPPSSIRTPVPPSARQAPPSSGRPAGSPSVAPGPVSVRASSPPLSARVSSPPASARVSSPPVPSSTRISTPPVASGRVSVTPAPGSVRVSSPPDSAPPSTSPGLAKVRPPQAAPEGEASPPSGPQSNPGGMFAAIRAVFSSK